MSEEQSLSAQLRSAREQRSMSIEDVQRQTGLSPNVLHGLEADSFDVVEAVITRMTLRDYAAYLGLDTDALLAQYDREAGQSVKPVRQPPIPLPPPAKAAGKPFDTALLRWVLPVVAALVVLFLLYYFLGGESDRPRSGFTPSDPPFSRTDETRSASASTPTRDQGETASSPAAQEEQVVTAAEESSASTGESTTRYSETPAAFPTLPAGASEMAMEEASADSGQTTSVSAADAALPEPGETFPANSDGAAAALSTDTGETTPSAATDAPVVESGGTLPVNRTHASGEPSAISATADSLLRLEVEVVDDSWVEIQGDDRVLFQGILSQGERRRWTTGEVFHVHSGRAHGLRYWFQDRLLGGGRLGDPTKVLRFRASRTSVTLLDADLQPLEELSPGPDEQP